MPKFGKQMIQIDSYRLQEELKKRGLKMSEVSRSFGYHDSYIRNCCQRGNMTPTTALLLENLYAIKRETYEASAQPVFNPCKASDQLDYDKLYSTIYDAVYNAVKEAWG